MAVGAVSCRKCGKRLNDDRREYCEDCEKERHYFTKARSVFIYNDAMRKSVLRYKNHGRREYADFYAEAISAVLGREIRAFKADGLIAVPVSRRTFEKRGFNQAELIAEKVGKRLGIGLYKNYMSRIGDTTEQKTLNSAERRKNLKKAFIINRNDVKLKRVLVLDDVYTTGSTADVIASELRRSGTESVMMVSLCSGSPV